MTAASAQEANTAFEDPFANGFRLHYAFAGSAPSAMTASAETQSSRPLRIDLSDAEGEAVAACKPWSLPA
jgi:hypothetical protein